MRIKTKEEFISQYGKDWRGIRYHFSTSMDYLFGRELSELEYKQMYIDRWNISTEMITDRPLLSIKPSIWSYIFNTKRIKNRTASMVKAIVELPEIRKPNISIKIDNELKVVRRTS